MNKKDRIAVVVSIPYLIFLISVIFSGTGDAVLAFFVFGAPFIIYWGYRFIKNDISFLNIEEK
ncbi:hypothetical protein [Sulfurovum sp.]|uniref:hypothetical protein n=1 Tax=Sulfurovum sp. TaxID=1969726 RepID=UPI002A368544|nr:hypothetical protein [Sulfurovum sp.]MDD3499787.1 hypothetical protein [Sulfurovum sp.]MDY0403556.1 hypothetical protein [Sulfurovum sp.]